MKRLVMAILVVSLLALSTTAAFATDEARVRVVHASPDAPAVDVLVDGEAAFTDAPFTGITDYASLGAGTYNVQVVPAGETEPVVIDADLDLAAGADYTVVAVGMLSDIEPLALVDDNSAPAAGKAHVRFVHASPDAPAVDVAVTDGPVLFANIAFKEVGTYLPVDAGTYDLEVRLAGTDTVALSIPGVSLADGSVYTAFAVGLADGEPSLQALLSVDATHEPAPEPTVEPAVLPRTGDPFSTTVALTLAGFGLGLTAIGIRIRRGRLIG